MARDSQGRANSIASNAVGGGAATRRRFLYGVGATGVAGLAGCMSGGDGGDGGGSGGDSTEEATQVGETDTDAINVEFWTPFSGPDGDTLGKMVETFNEDYDDVQIQAQVIPWDNYYTKLYTSMTGGQAPDMAVAHAVRLSNYESVAKPLDDAVDFGKYVESVSKRTQINGEHLALPLDTHPFINYYNKDIFEEAGLDPENPPEDPESFKEACNAVVENTDHWALDPNAEVRLLRTYFQLLKQRGGDLWTDDWEPAFNNEDGLAIAEYLNDAFHEWDWSPTEGDVGEDSWNRGECAFRCTGTWHYSQVEQNDYEWGVAKPFFAPGLEEGYARAGSHTIMLPQKSDESNEEAEAVLTAATALTQDLNSLWGIEAGHLPASQSVLESDELRNSEVWDKQLYKYAEMAENGQLAYYPSSAKTGEWTQAISQHLTDMRLGNSTPQEALDQAEQAAANVFQ